MRIDVKVALLPGRVLVKIRDKDGPGKERREIDGLFSYDKTFVLKSKGSNKYMISFMIGISMFLIRVKMVSNHLEK